MIVWCVSHDDETNKNDNQWDALLVRNENLRGGEGRSKFELNKEGHRPNLLIFLNSPRGTLSDTEYIFIS